MNDNTGQTISTEVILSFFFFFFSTLLLGFIIIIFFIFFYFYIWCSQGQKKGVSFMSRWLGKLSIVVKLTFTATEELQ